MPKTDLQVFASLVRKMRNAQTDVLFKRTDESRRVAWELENKVDRWVKSLLDDNPSD